MSVPTRVVNNDHFAAYLDTTDEWISTRTGIRERRWAAPEVTASMLAEPAAREAIAAANLSCSDIDGVICATVTPDNSFPSTACCLQHRLGLGQCLAFDLNAVCSGFVYALAVADSMIARGLAQNILVVGVDLFSKIIDHRDRSTCILFGDGAGAVVLRKSSPESLAAEQGIYGARLAADGSGGDILFMSAGRAQQADENSTLTAPVVKMNGKEVFKLAVRALAEVSESVIKEQGFSSADIDYFICHQANLRILSAVAKQLEVAESKLLVNVERYGNTSAASVPILLAESVALGKIKKGDLLLLNAFGGGLTWGAILLRL